MVDDLHHVDVNDALPAPAANLLVCDDSAGERTALAALLRRAGYGVEEAEDGESALSHLKKHHIDLVLLDLHMPKTDGFKVLSYLQEHRQALPIILLTGMAPDQIQHKMHALHQRQLPPMFLKPIDPDRLLQIIDLQLAGELPGMQSDPENPSGELA